MVLQTDISEINPITRRLVPKLNWQIRLLQLNPLEKVIFDQERRDVGLRTQFLASTIQGMMITVYEEEISRQLRNIGCKRETASLTNPSIIGRIQKQARDRAESLNNTFNYYLIGAILRTRQFYLKATSRLPDQMEYEIAVKNWVAQNDLYKGDQLTINTINLAKHQAAVEFFRRNRDVIDLEKSTAYYAGPAIIPTSSEQCRRRRGKGDVSVQWVIDNNEWPPTHPNCRHYWRYKMQRVSIFKRRSICGRVWRGA